MSITTTAELQAFMGLGAVPTGAQSALDVCELAVAAHLGMDTLAVSPRTESITPVRDRPTLEASFGPITTLTSITYNDALQTVPAGELTVEKWLIVRTQDFSHGRKYALTYSTGWTDATLDAQIKQAILATASHHLNGGGAGVSSQSVGDFSSSVEAGEGAQIIPPIARTLLQPWRRAQV